MNRRQFLKLSAACAAWGSLGCANLKRAERTHGDAHRAFDSYFLDITRGFLRNAHKTSPDFVACDFPEGTKLWSKAGWTSTARHDAAYLELPDGRRLIVVTCTTGHSRNRQIIRTIVKHVLDGAK